MDRKSGEQLVHGEKDIAGSRPDGERSIAGSGSGPDSGHDNVSPVQFERGPTRQLRRVGTKIGRKLLPFERLLFRVGPVHIYRGAVGNIIVRWRPGRRR